MSVTVDRVHDIPVDELRREYAHPVTGRPVIITGCIDHWPARKKWDLDYFERAYGDKQVRFDGKAWTVRDVAKALRSGERPAPYMNQIKFDEQFPELYPDIGELKYARENLLTHPFLPRSMRLMRGYRALFIGTSGSGFGRLHWDTSYLHVYISQVRGAKDFLLFAPGDSHHLYPRPNDASVSSIPDINDFDIEEYPDVKKATPIRFTVNEGETVFIPGGWWHSTKMNELSISVAESTLDACNWKLRRDWYREEYRRIGIPPWRQKALDAYMGALERLVA